MNEQRLRPKFFTRIFIASILFALTLALAVNVGPAYADQPIEAPPDLDATDGTYTDKVLVTWTYNVEATSYKVYRGLQSDGSDQVLVAQPSVGSYSDTSAVPGEVYYYQLRACKGHVCNGKWSVIVDGWRGLPLPTGLNASDGTYSDKIRIIWDQYPGVDVYKLYRSETEGGTKDLVDDTLTTETFDDATIGSQSVFYYWLIACNGGLCSDYSVFDTGWRSFDIPSGVSATDGTGGDIVVIWGEVGDATSYEVYRADADDWGTRILLDGNVIPKTYTDTSAAAGMDYTYWVTSCGTVGCSNFDDVDGADNGWATIAAPTNIDATDGTVTAKVVVTWDSVVDAVSYDVYRDATMIGSTSDTSFDDTDGEGGVVYDYKVVACGDDHCSVDSLTDSGWRINTRIFADGFESGDLSAWTLSKGKIQVDPTAAMNGTTYGAKFTIKNRKPKWVKDSTPDGETRYRARFFIDASNLTMKKKNLVKVFIGVKGKKNKPFIIQVKKGRNKFWVRAVVRLDGKKKGVRSKWHEIPGGASHIEIDWKAADNKTLHNGFLDIYVNGVLYETLSDLNNDTLVVNDVRLGIAGRIKRNFRVKGFFYIDEFDSDSLVFIGP